MKTNLKLGLILSTLTVLSFGDAVRPTRTNDLNCTASLNGEKVGTLSIRATAEATQLVLTKGLEKKEILNNAPLTVMNEGGDYIQQVSNSLGYNLLLTGEGLSAFLGGKSPQRVKLTGNINLFKANKTYELACSGTLQ